MITVIKNNNNKRKRRKKTRKKNVCLLGSDPGTLPPLLSVTTRPRGLSRPEAAKSFYLNKNDVIITVDTSNVV